MTVKELRSLLEGMAENLEVEEVTYGRVLFVKHLPKSEEVEDRPRSTRERMGLDKQADTRTERY